MDFANAMNHNNCGWWEPHPFLEKKWGWCAVGFCTPNLGWLKTPNLGLPKLGQLGTPNKKRPEQIPSGNLT